MGFFLVEVFPFWFRETLAIRGFFSLRAIFTWSSAPLEMACEESRERLGPMGALVLDGLMAQL